MSGSLRPAIPPKTDVDVTLICHRNMTVNASRGSSHAGHMLYCTRTTEIFSVCSFAAPGTVERARRRSEEIAAVPYGDL
jgi:hypothetical protein